MTRQYPNTLRLLLLFLTVPATADTGPTPIRIDVFTPSTIAVIGVDLMRERVADVRIGIYNIDGIEQVKTALSQDLPTQAEAARRVALERMKHFSKAEHDRLRHSAEALLLAQQLGVRRYPAVVLDRRWVIYGVTDLTQAYSLFQKREVEENR